MDRGRRMIANLTSDINVGLRRFPWRGNPRLAHVGQPNDEHHCSFSNNNTGQYYSKERVSIQTEFQKISAGKELNHNLFSRQGATWGTQSNTNRQGTYTDSWGKGQRIKWSRDQRHWLLNDNGVERTWKSDAWAVARLKKTKTHCSPKGKLEVHWLVLR